MTEQSTPSVKSVRRDMNHEVVYLSGKITDGDRTTPESIQANKDKFVKKAGELSSEGKVVFIPGENFGRVGQENNWTWKQYMRPCITIMKKCDTVYMLEKWEESRGARIEHFLAKRKGMNVVYERKRT